MNNIKIFEKSVSPVAEEIRSFERAFLYLVQSDFVFLQQCYKNHIVEVTDKRLFPSLFFLSQGLIHRPDPKSNRLAVLVEFLNLAALIHATVRDVYLGSNNRERNRNVITENRKHVLIGDYLLAKVLNLGVETRWNGVLDIIARTVMTMAEGKLRHALDGGILESGVED